MALVRTAVLLAIPAAMLTTGLATIVETAAAAGPAPTPAQSLCGERKAVIAELHARYGETPRSIGLAQDRGIVEVYASDRTGSWTILLTTTAGQTCLIASGDAFEAVTTARSGTPA